MTQERIPDSDSYGTPIELFNAIQKFYNVEFDCDVAASDENHLCEKYYTKENSGLDPKNKWGKYNWCNPPYSDIMPWVERAYAESREYRDTYMLLPADISTAWYKFCYENASRMHGINKRIKFNGAKHSAKFASVIVHFFSRRVIHCHYGLLKYTREKELILI